MAGASRFGVVHVPDFSPGMSSYMRIGTAAEDDYHWRDHTDGNRVTTTRGDKVEIIEGNYHLIVRGRQEHESGLNAKAGEVGQNSITYRGTVKREGGRIIEETWKGMVDTTFHGDVVDQYYGSRVESQTGSESPGPDRENPDVTEKTWAKRIESYTGSAALRVPSIRQESWIDRKVSRTDARSMTEETIIEGETRSTTKAGTITSETTADAMTDTTTVSGDIESTTRAASIISTTHGDSESETYGSSTSYQEGDAVAIVDGIENTLNVGMVNEVVLGMMNDATLGVTAGVTVGGSVSVDVGVKADITVGAHIDVELAEITLEPAQIKAHLDRTRTALFRKSIAAVNLLL